MTHSQVRPNHADICCKLHSEADRLQSMQLQFQNGGSWMELLNEIYTVRKNLNAIKQSLIEAQVKSCLKSIESGLSTEICVEKLEQMLYLFQEI